MLISIIAAMGNNRVIGVNNQLPWHLPADLRHFKRITMGKPIIMGRKTYESIGKPLPGRRNIVISSNLDYRAAGCVVVDSVERAIAAAKDVDAKDIDEAMVIGGAEIFRQTMPLARRLYLTIIDANFAGDRFFLSWNDDDWIETSSESHAPDEKNIYPYRFLQLDRRGK